MTDRPLHVALREWRAHFAQPQTLGVMACVAGALAVAGPFETGEVLRLVPRFVYWAFVAVSCYSVGFVVSAALRHVLRDQSEGLILGATCLVTGLLICAVILVTNLAVFGILPQDAEWLRFFGSVLGVSTMVSVGFHLVERSGRPEPPEAGPPPVLDRLPLDKRGTLYALSVEDHYVRVRTDKGTEMILMRLADAMRETRGTDGFQVHRSHWVARAAVVSATREGDRAVLTLRDGATLPVSRRYVPVIKEAGLLPR